MTHCAVSLKTIKNQSQIHLFHYHWQTWWHAVTQRVNQLKTPNSPVYPLFTKLTKRLEMVSSHLECLRCINYASGGPDQSLTGFCCVELNMCQPKDAIQWLTQSFTCRVNVLQSLFSSSCMIDNCNPCKFITGGGPCPGCTFYYTVKLHNKAQYSFMIIYLLKRVITGST